MRYGFLGVDEYMLDDLESYAVSYFEGVVSLIAYPGRVLTQRPVNQVRRFDVRDGFAVAACTVLFGP